MSKSLLDLPSSVVFRGSKHEEGREGKASLHSRVDRSGEFVISIWGSRDLATQAQPDFAKDFNELRITDLVAGIIPTANQRIYLCWNPTAPQMGFDQDEFDVKQLQSNNLILLPKDFESALSIYQCVARHNGEEIDESLVREIRFEAKTLHTWKLVNIMQKIELTRQRREQWPERSLQLFRERDSECQWNGQMQCNVCEYFWTSRRSTPPAQCPKCRSNYISQLFE